jgi:hypothetical protein
LGVAERGELDERHSVGEVVGDLGVGGRGKGEAGLAYSGRADEREQARALGPVAHQPPADDLQLARPVDERGRLRRQPSG